MTVILIFMEQGEKKKLGGATAGVVGVLALLLFKFKAVIFGAFKALPLLKFGWILKSGGSMILSLGLYAATFGWRYAVTLIVLLYVHEMGHFIFMKAKGLNPDAPVFVPFLGAYVAMKNMPEDAVTHAWVAYAGPLVGGIGAWAMYWFGSHSGNDFMIAAANTGFILNLLQLVPIKPFDGGFIAHCISKWLSIPGILALAYMAFTLHSILLLIILVVAAAMLFKNWNNPATDVPLSEKLQVSLAYFALAGSLGWMFWASQTALRDLGHGV